MKRNNPKRIVSTFLLVATVILVSAVVFGSDQGAHFVHLATINNSVDNVTVIDHPLSNSNPSAIVHITQSWNPYGGLGTYNAEAIGVWYDGSVDKWSVFNQTTTIDMPEDAGFNVWIPPSDGSSFVHVATLGNHSSNIDNPLTNNNPAAVLQITQNWNPGGVGGTYNDHEIGVYYTGSKWSIFNQDFVAIPVGASFNVTLLTDSERYYVHSAEVGNIAGNWTAINSPLTNNKPNAIVTVTQNWEPGEVYNNHPIATWYTGSTWAILNGDHAAMPEGAAFNISVPAERKGLVLHRATAANTALNSTLIDHPISNNNRNALVYVTQNWNAGSGSGIYNPRPIGVWYTGSEWSVFNQDLVEMPIDAAFNIVIPQVDNTSFLHTADAGNTVDNSTRIDFPPVNDDPNVILHVTQNYNPSDTVGTYNNHFIGVYHNGSRWSVFQQDGTAMTDGASFNIWVPPTDASTFVHTSTAGNVTGNRTTIDNSLTNGHPEAILVVTQNWNPGGGAGIYNDHPIAVIYYLSEWSILNEDGSDMPVGASFNVTVETPVIFANGFESGDTLAWSSTAP